MSSEFTTYLQLGFSHIADLKGNDHIVFLVALTAGYALADWKRLLWLVTAFTIGHSVTLILATLRLVRTRSSLTELAIAATIVIAGAYGVASHRQRAARAAGQHQGVLYAMAGGFGLIHGLGFSSFLRSLLGGEENILVPLLAFNVGLEAGQLLIVAVILLVGAGICDGLGASRHRWALALSVASLLAGLQMILERASGL